MDPWMVEVTKEEIENAMLLPEEYKEVDGKYYIQRGMLDGYIAPMPGELNSFNDGMTITLSYNKREDFNLDNINEHVDPEVVSD